MQLNRDGHISSPKPIQLNQSHILRADICHTPCPFAKSKTHLIVSDFSLLWAERETMDSHNGKVQGWWLQEWLDPGTQEKATDWVTAWGHLVCALHVCTQTTLHSQNHALWHELHPLREKDLFSVHKSIGSQIWEFPGEIWNWPHTRRPRRERGKRQATARGW